MDSSYRTWTRMRTGSREPIVTTVHEDELGARHEIGSGGTANVFALKSYMLAHIPEQKWVYKKFKPTHRPVSLYGMRALVKLIESLEPKRRDLFDRAFNWPERAVVDDGDGASGVVLPLIAEEYFVDLRLSDGTVKRKPAEAQFLLSDRDYCATVGLPYPDEEQRRQLCRSLCYAIALLHRADVVYGDLSARNILFRLHPRPAVKLVDCDAVRVSGAAAAFGAQPHSPDWEPPEAIAARKRRDSGWTIQSKETDLYKLGLAVLRILTPGKGSSTNVDPASARGVLPSHLYTLLQRSLSPDPNARPTAKTWYEELQR